MSGAPFLATLLSLSSGGAGPTFEAFAELTTVFVVDKSLNRNQVVYALALDRQCAFRREAPVQVYWQMRERGERETEAVLDVEQPIIGLGPQTITERRADGGRVTASIRALPDRPMTFTARRGAEGCEALATTVIDGREATLQHVYARVWLLGVISVDLEGRVDGRAVTERLR